MANQLILNIKKTNFIIFPLLKETDSFNNLKLLALECKELVEYLGTLIIEGVCGIRPKVTFDAMSNSPSHSQLNIQGNLEGESGNLSEVT